MEIFFNPWVVGTGSAVTAGLILYYIFGIGKASSEKDHAAGNRERLGVQRNARQEEYEIELKSFRNDMVRRGLAHSSIRLQGEAALRKKFGIQDPSTTLNEIELTVDGKIYRVTNQNNGNKYDRAVRDAGPNATSQQVLAHYDKLAGYIQDENGKKVSNGRFWSEEKIKLEERRKRGENWEWIKESTSHPVIASLILITLLAFLWYVFGLDLSRFR